MDKNNFQQLQLEEERSISPDQLHQIRKIEGGILHSLHFFRFVGNVFHMYFPGFARAVVGNASQSSRGGLGPSIENETHRNDPASTGESH